MFKICLICLFCGSAGTADVTGQSGYNMDKTGRMLQEVDLEPVVINLRLLPENFQKLYYQLVEQGMLNVKLVESTAANKNGEYYYDNGGIQFNITYWPDSIGVSDCFAESLRHELFHYYQDQLNLTRMYDFKAPIEYQENLMGWLAKGTCNGSLGESSVIFDEWITRVITPEGEIDLNKFMDSLDQWYEDFINNHSGSCADDYKYVCKDSIADMKWEEVLAFFGYIVLK